jgi:hypothetical protein
VTQLISFIAIAMGLGVSLASLALRKRVEGGSDAMVKAKQALSSLQAGLLPAEMVARIFDRTDLVYVESQSSNDIREMFMSERKLVVLSWIRRVRQEVDDLRNFHLGSARFYAGLSLTTEISLGFDFAMLLLACRALQVSVYLGGPYAAPRMVASTAAIANRVCAISERSLAFLTPAYVVPAAQQAVIRPVR